MAHVLAVCVCVCPPERCSGIISHLEFCPCAPVEGPGQSTCSYFPFRCFLQVLHGASWLGRATGWTQRSLDLPTGLKNKYSMCVKMLQFFSFHQKCAGNSHQRCEETKLFLYFANGTFLSSKPTLLFTLFRLK